MTRVSVADLQQAKREGRKIVGIVVWDAQLAAIADAAGADFLSVGDSIGVNLWAHSSPLEIGLEEMLIVARAVRRGSRRALVSCDFPFGPLQEGPDAALRAAIRLVKEAGVDMVKLDAAAQFPDAVAAITRAGIPVFAQIGVTPQTGIASAYDGRAAKEASGLESVVEAAIAEARRVEDAGAAMIDFTNSGPVAGAAVCEASNVPVVGGLGGGPWLDGRVRMATAAIGYAASELDEPKAGYGNVAQVAFEGISALVDDVRSGRQIRG